VPDNKLDDVDDNNDTSITDNVNIPILPLRDVVVFPNMVIPLFVGREKSIVALDHAMKKDKKILLLTQKTADIDEPSIKDLFTIGTLSTILQLLKLPDGTVKVLVEGNERAKAKNLSMTSHFQAEFDLLQDDLKCDEKETHVLVRSISSLFEEYVKINKKIPPEILTSLSGITDPSRLAYTVAAHMQIKVNEKQDFLEIIKLKLRLEKILGIIQGEIDVLQLEKRIRARVKQQMEKSQREYYLNEQMKSIQKELGEMDDSTNEIQEIERKIKKAGMPKETHEKAETEINKLKIMPPMSAEATVVRNYLDWLLKVPWKKRSKISTDIAHSESILDKDHYGLKKVKERIIEYLAVQQRVKISKAPILCFVGPPGVGKTSLGRSIARATKRKFVRMSLGGMRDEAEIRGHRRTYIGSMPGKIIQNLSKTKVRNPLFLLDEVDKMSMDFRGDPSSALLEVLDPEQNFSFSDHYLEVEYDLSDVMFICTANSLNIPPPLLDRMEIIRLPGYTEDEKFHIAQGYLISKQYNENGIQNNELVITKTAIFDIIRYYTRESGVRNLERGIAKICRKVVKNILSSTKKNSTRITSKGLSKYLGVRQFRYGEVTAKNQIGQVNGLAWTEVGGELLTIEASILLGKGKLSHTGKLGDVMTESIKAAMTVVRSRSEILGLDKNFYQKKDFHVHVPEGATPKDGPSAGVGMCTALVSALTNIPVKCDVAMTGEITLRGEVLPIGGLKEKLLAAQRGNIKTVLIPQDNEKDLVEIPKKIKDKLIILPVKWIDEILKESLQYLPTPNRKKTVGEKPSLPQVDKPEKTEEVRRH
ncbi:uncharacterized protein METZ01_LOCUS81872, partial [marine metagenome]